MDPDEDLQCYLITFIVVSHPDQLNDLSVLLELLGKLDLDTEGAEGRQILAENVLFCFAPEMKQTGKKLGIETIVEQNFQLEFASTSGLYYKHSLIINEASGVISE